MSTGAFISTVSVATGRSLVRGPGPGRVVVRWSDDIDSLASFCILLHHLFQPSLELYFSLSLIRTLTRYLSQVFKPFSFFQSTSVLNSPARWFLRSEPRVKMNQIKVLSSFIEIRKLYFMRIGFSFQSRVL